MKFLLDVSVKKLQERMAEYPDLIRGQLATPLTGYKLHDVEWALDNGAFSRFDINRFKGMLTRNTGCRSRCLFVAAPDVVASARRTLEVFDCWYSKLCGWPIALVLQDGIEDLPIPWKLCDAVFVGGTTRFKDSECAAHCVRAALALDKHVHVGRVNTIVRYRRFADLGAHTCDGSGVSRFDWMLSSISDGVTDDQPSLFEESVSDNGRT